MFYISGEIVAGVQWIQEKKIPHHVNSVHKGVERKQIKPPKPVILLQDYVSV